MDSMIGEIDFFILFVLIHVDLDSHVWLVTAILGSAGLDLLLAPVFIELRVFS